MIRVLLSVRGKILLSIGLLTVLIVVTLWLFVTSLQAASDQARIIDAAGEIKTASINIDLLSREITTTTTNNQNVILALASVLKDDSKFIDSITRFMNGDPLVSRAGFASFMPFLNKEFRSDRTENPEILAAIYAPVIAGQNRGSFEASIRDEGYPDFQILSWQSGKQQIPAPSSEQYFPINYIVPFDVNRTTSFGIDLGSNDQVKAILAQTRDTGQPLILSNPPFHLSHSERDYTYWIVAPVYTQASPPTVEARQAGLQGYLILSIDGETLIQAAASRLVQRSVVLGITDNDASGNNNVIFTNSRLHLTPFSGLITASFPLDVLGSKWRVTLAQSIDIADSLAKLADTANVLNQRITLLQSGTSFVTEPKNPSPAQNTLSDAYTRMADQNRTLQKNIQTFLKATDNSAQEGLLPALQDNALEVFQSSTDFVDRLEQALELRVAQAIQISGVVAGLALIIISAGFILVRQILRNLWRVNRAALALADGHLSERVEVGTQDEIGHIATSMNLMASQLQELINTLEQRVADRTRDLEIARKQAERASNAKSIFLSNMSHELRTPLNVIIGYARSMLNTPQMFGGTPIPAVHRPFIQLVEDNGQYLIGLINDILDLSKIEAGKLDLRCSSVDLMSVMQDVLAITIGLLKDKPVQIHQKYDNSLPHVWADPMRLRQICLNLMSNAVKFTSTGSITLSAHVERSCVRIAVTDTGIGISTQALATIFNRYEQAGHDTDRQYGGTGLGLNISKRLCIMHGGDLTVESVPGQGSTFSFAIPVSTSSQQESVLASGTTFDDIEIFGGKTNSDNIATILLVEVDSNMRDLLHDALESAGHVVIDTHDGEKVIELAVGLLPNLIIIDIQLSTVVMRQLLAMLKQNAGTSTIPVIICTMDEKPGSLYTAGTAVYVQKPTTTETILEVVQTVFNDKFNSRKGT